MGGSWLKAVASQHKEWIKIVNEFGVFDEAEDVVQDAYISLYKYSDPDKIIKNGKIIRGYMFFTLKSLAYQRYNKNQRMQKVRLDDENNIMQLPSIDNVEENKAYHKICELVDDVAEDWHWYDKMLWKAYSMNQMSIRKLAKETRISWVSIFNTLKNLKTIIKEKVKEDYEDYKAGDWEWINTNRQKD